MGELSKIKKIQKEIDVLTEYKQLLIATTDAKAWGIWPLTVVPDRYNGIYIGGKWLALHAYPNDFPPNLYGEDLEYNRFISNKRNLRHIGIGDTPQAAIYDLKYKLDLEGVK